MSSFAYISFSNTDPVKSKSPAERAPSETVSDAKPLSENPPSSAPEEYPSQTASVSICETINTMPVPAPRPSLMAKDNTYVSHQPNLTAVIDSQEETINHDSSDTLELSVMPPHINNHLVQLSGEPDTGRQQPTGETENPPIPDEEPYQIPSPSIQSSSNQSGRSSAPSCRPPPPPPVDPLDHIIDFQPGIVSYMYTISR